MSHLGEYSTKVFSVPSTIPGSIPRKRGFFGSLFLGFILSRKIPGSIPGKMSPFQSATVVFDRIAQERISTKSLAGIPKHLRSVCCQHHYVFFMPGNPVIIIGILHEKMDFLARLANRINEE
jgi:hypothetical protein